MSLYEDYGYEYESDPVYCYPGTPVLKNKLGIMDAGELKQAEREITALRTAQVAAQDIAGGFDSEHLKRIHAFLFQDIYDWAGHFRIVNISKGSAFCRFEYIARELDRLFAELHEEQFLQTLREKKPMAERLAYYLAEINAIHPFREGNGRTQRLFIEKLARVNGWQLDFMYIRAEEMVQASVESFAGEYADMERLIFRCLSDGRQNNTRRQGSAAPR